MLLGEEQQFSPYVNTDMCGHDSSRSYGNIGRSTFDQGQNRAGVGVLGPTAHPGLPLEVLFGVGRCYRL
jgi:hypothetical protein